MFTYLEEAFPHTSEGLPYLGRAQAVLEKQTISLEKSGNC